MKVDSHGPEESVPTSAAQEISAALSSLFGELTGEEEADLNIVREHGEVWTLRHIKLLAEQLEYIRTL
jgi:hypothetical protein